MASKNRRNRGEVFKQEDIIQAVVIADSFNVRFSPVTQAKPRALLPLVNLPLIDYTLEFLCNAGIQQVIVFCCIHADQIKSHIKTSKWQSSHSSMEVLIVVSEGCMSVGDALRDIDAKALINNDFVLVNGDMVANVNLAPIIKAHKQRRMAEKNALMTLLFKPAPPGHPTRCAEEEVLMAVERDTRRIVSYQKVNKLTRYTFPLELLSDKSEVELRFDLLDCHISICSPTVPTLFTDNFDFLTREQFVKGVLVNEEILGNTIHMHELKDEYAARVSNLHMYDAVSQDVLSRWSYPMVPDKNVTECSSNKYTHGRHNIYLHKDVTLARGCILEENVIIGKGSSVGSNTRIENSVIGKNVHIGKDVRISGAYIWDDCKVGSQCELTSCLLDTGVHITDSVVVKPGCVLAKNVKVGPDVTLDNATLWVSQAPTDDFDEAPIELNPVEVGSEGVAYRHEEELDSDDETHDLSVWGRHVESEEEEISEESDSESEEIRLGKTEDDDDDLFYEEVIGTLERAVREDIATDNIVLEVNSVKSAYGIYINQVNVLLTKALLELPLKQQEHVQTNQYIPLLKQNFSKLLPVLQNYIRNAESQTDCIYSIEDTCVNNSVVEANLMKVLHFLYDQEILSEDIIISWHGRIRSEDDDCVRKDMRDKVISLVKWLQEAEEESDDDSD